MNINALSTLLPSFLQPGVNNAAANPNAGSVSQILADTPQISQMAQFLSQLQQLQQQNPDQFKQVAATIADKLQKAALDAASQGDTKRADQLNKLAGEFQTSSQTGQVPTLQALQQAGLSGHHHHGHHGGHHGGHADPLSALQSQTGSTQDTLTSIFDSVLNGTGGPTSGPTSGPTPAP